MNTFLGVITVCWDAFEVLGLLCTLIVMVATTRRGKSAVPWRKLVNVYSVSMLLILITLNLAVWTR